MVTNKTKLNKIIKDNNVNPNVTYYLDLGRKSHEKYLLSNSECDLDISVSSYEKALELDSNNSEAIYKLACLLWEKGQIDINKAILDCTRAINLSPNNIDARLYLGYFFKINGRTEEAITQFQKAISLNFAKSAKPRIALGLSLIQQAKITKNKLEKVATGLIHFICGLVLLAYDTNSLKIIKHSVIEELNVLYYKTKGQIFEHFKMNRQALEVYNSASYLLKNKEIFFNQIGNLYKKKHNNYLASENYRKAVILNPLKTDNYYNLISVLDEDVDINELITCYKKLGELEPLNAAHKYSLGHLYIENENYFGAISCFREAIEINPQNAYYHNSMAYALVNVEDFDGAISEYNQSIALSNDPYWTSIVAQALAALYYQAKSNHEASLMAYQIALQNNPNSTESLISMAEVYYDKSDVDSALLCYQKAIALDPENSQSYCNIGFLHWEKSQTEEAIKYYNKAIEIAPEYDIAYNNLGVAYLDGCLNPKKGLEMFEKSLKINPNYALSYYNKARCLHLLNRKEQSAEYYQMALDINTYTKELNPDEITTKLDQLFEVN